MGLGHTHRVVAVAVLLQFVDFGPHSRVGRDIGRAVNLGGDGFHFVPERVGVFIDKAHLGSARLGQFDNDACQFFGASRALGPVTRHHHRHTLLVHLLAQQVELGLGVRGEVVDRHHAGQAVAVANVVHMPLQVGHAFFQRCQVGGVEVFGVHAAVVLEGAQGRHHHHRIGAQARLAALDVNELLSAQISTKAGLGDHILAKLERSLGGGDGVAAVGNVGKRAAVDDGRVVLQGLHQVGLDRVFEQRGHGALGLEVTGANGCLLAGVANDDVAQALLEVSA